MGDCQSAEKVGVESAPDRLDVGRAWRPITRTRDADIVDQNVDRTAPVERLAPSVMIGTMELTVTPRGPSSFAKSSTQRRGAILLPL